MHLSFEDIHNTIDPNRLDHLQDPVLKYVRTDFPKLNDTLTVEGALRIIREQGIGERIVYFYLTDLDERLVGIVPTRRLLTSRPNVLLTDIMSTNIVSVDARATVLEACEMFVQYKLLAFPVLDRDGRICGVVDAGLFTEETLSFAERHHFDDIFQLIGFGISQVKGKSVFGNFRFRFPWLIATMASGTVCAMLTGYFEATLAEAIVLAFFMTLVLALGESVSIQSMTVALQNLHFGLPSLAGFVEQVKREIMSTALLGAACGSLVGLVALLWRGDLLASVVIGFSILGSVCFAGLIGLGTPTLLHRINEETKIAAGPITLAMADIVTLIIYFNLATVILM